MKHVPRKEDKWSFKPYQRGWGKLCAAAVAVCCGWAALSCAIAGPPTPRSTSMGEPNPLAVSIPKSANLGEPGTRDIALADLTTTTVGAPHGMTRIIATVTNLGTGPVGPTHTSFSDGGRLIASISTSAIPPGGSAHVYVDYALIGQPGEHKIAATGNATNSVAESKRDNNTKVIALRVKAGEVIAMD